MKIELHLKNQRTTAIKSKSFFSYETIRGVCNAMCMTWKLHELILVGPSDLAGPTRELHIQLLRLSYQKEVLKSAKETYSKAHLKPMQEISNPP